MQEMNVASWAEFESIVGSKKLLMQYTEGSNEYDIYAPEAGVFLWHVTLVKGTSDCDDFEDNHKASSNQPIEIKSGTGRPIRFSPSPQPLGTVQKFKGYQIILEEGESSAYVDIEFDHTVYIKGGSIISAGVDEDDYISAAALIKANGATYLDGIIDHGYMIPNVKLDFTSPECMEFPSSIKLRVTLNCHTAASTNIKANVLVEYFE